MRSAAALERGERGELFAACSRKSYEQVEELLAARFPRPDVRDLIRRLPASEVDTPDIGTERMETKPEPTETRQIGLAPGPRSAEWILPLVAELPGESPRPSAQRGAVKPLSADRFSVNFTADGEFRELLEEVRALLSHAEPKGDLMRVMKRGLEALRGELLKKRFGVGSKLRQVRLKTSESPAAPESPAPQTAKRTRHVAAAIAREVYVRDQGRCTFCADDGRRCGERRLLQLDHVVPHAQGGEATVANLRLRCRAHNLHTAREHFGREYVRSATERTRKRARRVRFDRQGLDRSAPGRS